MGGFTINSKNTGAATVSKSKFFNTTGVYDVVFAGWSKKNSDKDGKHHEMLCAKFEGTGEFEGKEYELTIFTPEVTPRSKGQWGYQVGKHEEPLINIATVLLATSEKYKEFRNAGNSLDGATWDEFRDVVIAYNEDSIGSKTKLKLIARPDKKGYIRCNIPAFNLSFTKEQNEKQGQEIMDGSIDPYMKSRWIGPEIALTSKEIKDMTAASSTTASNPDESLVALGFAAPAEAPADDMTSLLND